jgi:hypothetical protein
MTAVLVLQHYVEGSQIAINMNGFRGINRWCPCQKKKKIWVSSSSSKMAIRKRGGKGRDFKKKSSSVYKSSNKF